MYRPVYARNGAAAMTLLAQFGNRPPQTVEMSGFRLLNFDKRYLASELPHVPQTYPGREADAPWRVAARESIARHRMSDLRVEVVDADGRLVVGADVSVRMRRHAFAFGSRIDEVWLMDEWDTPDGRTYREQFLALFNTATIERSVQWRNWVDDASRERLDRLLSWLESNDVAVVAQGLTPLEMDHLPPDVLAVREDVDALRAATLEHLTSIVGGLRGRVGQYQVSRLLWGHRRLAGTLGYPDSVAEWLRAARAADPDATLTLFENNLIGGRKSEFFETLIAAMLERGAPLHAISIGGHSGLNGVPAYQEVLERFGQFGLPIVFSDFAIDAWDEHAQADLARDFYTVMFADPRVIGIHTAGFWDERHPISDSSVYRADWRLKPAGRAYLDLVFGEWWTDVDGRTGDDGTFVARGYLGRYDVTATQNGRSVTGSHDLTVPHDLPSADRRVRLTLPAAE